MNRPCRRLGPPTRVTSRVTRLAKAVVLSDGGRYTLAVLPASHHLRLSDLRTGSVMRSTWPANRKPRTSSATVRSARFRQSGACYGLAVIIDNSIDQQQELYFEGGDHATLVHVNGAEFARLNPRPSTDTLARAIDGVARAAEGRHGPDKVLPTQGEVR